MQFLIHTKGNALNVCDKAYVVDAPSESEAKEMAVSSFESEFGVFADSITTQLFKRTNKSIMAYICMLIPILLSLISWKNGHDTYSISPSLVSCIYSVAFYAAFIVRFKGIHRTVGSWIDIVFSVLIILLMSTFIQLILVEKTINLLENARKQLSKLEEKILGYYLDGLTYSEIAKTVGKSAKSVDNAVQRIRRKIARQLNWGDISNG